MKSKNSMLTVHLTNIRGRLAALLLTALALVSPTLRLTARAQMANVLPNSEDTLPRKTEAPLFRMETLPVGSDAELLTVFGSLKGLKDEGTPDKSVSARGDNEVPLVSILRDTLGDTNPENDRLR